ncbi:Na+/H+ antiporter subunit E [Pontibacter pamirensis]|uniref:Na+/H+ antiporter subunit E n=1 Tax=Pontibacter pamirensis TaxID=2562824 RepID=UPI00138A5DCE|nr:Na+/H+ antiporter subunit E [Pontibacter pamirensis]
MRVFFLHSMVTFVVVFTFLQQGWVDMPYNAATASIAFLMLFILLWLSTWFYDRTYFRKLPKALNFVFFFLKELLLANLKIAFDILTPHYYMNPTVIAFPLRVKTNFEIMLLANMITLTPGTLSIDVSKNRKLLYVHALYVKDNNVENLKKEIREGFERRILELTT